MIAIPHRLVLKLVVAIGCALLLALLINDRNRWKSRTAHYAALLSAERSAHSATVASYRAAADRARREDSENLARVKAEQAAINERTAHDYQSRIAAARARADQLQRHARAAEADPGGVGATPVPELPAAPEAIAQAAGENRLPQSDRLIATEQAIQLDELIKWVRRQHAIPANAEPAERRE